MSSATRPRKVKCSVCNEKTEEFLTCFDCKLNFHYECCKVDAQLILMLKNNTSPGLSWRWRCASCSQHVGFEDVNFATNQLKDISSLIKTEVEREIGKANNEMKAEIKALKSALNVQFSKLEEQSKILPSVVETKIEKISKEVGAQNNKCNDTFASYASKLAQTLTNNTETYTHIQQINEKVAGLTSDIKAQAENDEEKRRILSKQMNVCIFNIPESTSSDSEISLKDDIENIKSALDSKNVYIRDDCKGIKRIGIKKNDKVRPIVMKLSSNNKRLELLKLRDIKLRINEEEELSIFIAPDRTPKQQATRKILRAALKLRTENGEKDLVIRNDKIVSAYQFQSIPQNYWD